MKWLCNVSMDCVNANVNCAVFSDWMLLVIRAFNIELFQLWGIFSTIHKRVFGISIKISNKEKRKMNFCSVWLLPHIETRFCEWHRRLGKGAFCYFCAAHCSPTKVAGGISPPVTLLKIFLLPSAICPLRLGTRPALVLRKCITLRPCGGSRTAQMSACVCRYPIGNARISPYLRPCRYLLRWWSFLLS